MGEGSCCCPFPVKNKLYRPGFFYKGRVFPFLNFIERTCWFKNQTRVYVNYLWPAAAYHSYFVPLKSHPYLIALRVFFRKPNYKE
ncbi:MAG: hypothetical protein A2W90_11460 [Bacteroidetes bacterium GWF2_42_66]|nr:MAG: hypothetical protein A2W92_13465 [Bacteroidetes bacterium GWA2_42_15]OFY01807.1 MAG: hypothetical protein A2W89_23110 [Bacteroidetes bacterium GWE2_42_39]OFY44899.1 MAG: hypothetical protein A2W90_11460 [Bacteroidetes bacterium GWF2_42_66]HBL76026.1 hypothetical protein [Prolixibacteraceae bacterium]HCU62142.1 hypothetical protein [Prolixibacteraceae bacterium]